MTDVTTTPPQPATAAADPAPTAPATPVTAPAGLIVLGAPGAEACTDGSC